MSPLLIQVIVVWLRSAVIKYLVMNVCVSVDELGAHVPDDNLSAASRSWLICWPISSRLPLVTSQQLVQSHDVCLKHRAVFIYCDVLRYF